jgi:hypothetical protein
MAVKDPNYDLRPNLLGGSDTWDQGPGGVLLLDDYFAAPVIPPSGAVFKRWNGSAWVAATIKHGVGWPAVSINAI